MLGNPHWLRRFAWRSAVPASCRRLREATKIALRDLLLRPAALGSALFVRTGFLKVSFWDIPEALDHDLILKHLKNECENADLDCVIFEGFKAFHDPRAVELLHVRIWLDVPREVARKRRLARNKRWTAEHFDKQIWANHLIYKKDVNERLGSTMQRFSGVDKVVGCRRNLWRRQDAAPFASIASVVVDAARMQDPW